MQKPIYLDYAATTAVDEQVAEKMCQCLTKTGTFGNPASRTHQFGWEASKLVEIARNQVAELINANPKDIIWTSGATEANNLAIKGIAFANKNKGRHIITSQTEHKAVLDTCKFLQKNGFEVTYIKPETNGVIDPAKISQTIRDDTILLSIMQINNETGTIQDIAAIGDIARKNNIIFHVDAAQAAGKIPIDLNHLPVDLMSFSAHKIYGPKGIGALFVRNANKNSLVAQIHGGGHEHGLRSGTLATHQIVGMGEAFRLAKLELEQNHQHLQKLHDRFLNGIKNIEAIRLNSDINHSVPNIVNVSFNFIEGESLILATKDLAVSTGSACTSATLQPSYVLKAMGLPDELAHSSIRFSFGKYTTTTEIDYTIQLIVQQVQKLREISPLWDMYKAGIDLNSISWQDEDH